MEGDDNSSKAIPAVARGCVAPTGTVAPAPDDAEVVERLAHASSCVRELALWVLPKFRMKVDEKTVLAATARLTTWEWKARQYAHTAVTQLAAL